MLFHCCWSRCRPVLYCHHAQSNCYFIAVGAGVGQYHIVIMHKQIAISVLLERVFLRIGSTETDAQLETELKRFLCPVLLKLASQTEGVRKKVKKKQYWCMN